MSHRPMPATGLLDWGPLRPTLVFLAITFGAVAIERQGTSWGLVAIAGVLGGAMICAAAWAPWHRIAGHYQALLAVTAVVIITILRHNQGAASTGYSVLALLPVTWVALVVGRRAVVLLSGLAATLLALPMLVDDPSAYPAHGWRAIALWLVASLCIGLIIDAVVAEQREHAADAARQADALADALDALESVASVARDISAGADARQRICDAARSSVNASVVTISEREGDGFAITGAAGVSPDVQSATVPSASLEAYYSRRRVFIPDVTQHAGLSPRMIEETGSRSVLFEPIVRHGLSVGVIGVGWSTPLASIDAKTAAVLSYLAAEAASAIERSDLLARLAVLARTDDLTSIPNRRAWDLELEHALTEPLPICVAMLDLDHFKVYNDQHGHVAGDRLLQECARAWGRQMRSGDLIARYGGEEFAVLIRDCSLGEARRVLERIRRATPAAVTCSLGVAERRPEDDPEALLQRADAALYRAKNEGRNQLQTAA
jgi:diguanylate cyclase (GGDEF)-like protein